MISLLHLNRSILFTIFIIILTFKPAFSEDEAPDIWEKKEIEEKLPGPYTFIVKLIKECPISKNINPKDNTIGIRLPNHYIIDIVKEVGNPIITTSANKHGEKFMTSLENLDQDIVKEFKDLAQDLDQDLEDLDQERH